MSTRSLAEEHSMVEKTSVTNPMLSPTALHLEKMGRELKCPICLSLLNQAASLTCNHVFCNACILRSIKSASVCPVCKVPCSRREVRIAPHMDSLVTIYRNMEMAAGINLFGSQPSISKDSTDDLDKENIIPCQNKSKRKPAGQPGVKCKRAKGCERKPSRLSVVSSHKVTENRTAENVEQKTPNQEIPSPHRPVKHSFPSKKRVQVSLYPPGSTEETPLRPVKKISNSEILITQNETGDNRNLPLTSLDNMHFGLDSQICISSQPKVGAAALNSMKDAPSSHRAKLDDLGNPVLSPFFWLRDNELEEADGAQLTTTQPTQITQIAQASPAACLSFSDLKDSDDEGYRQELQSDERNVGIAVPDTFDSEMFDWTQRPCSPELTSSPRKQKSPTKSEFMVLLPKYFEDNALLVNGPNKSNEETDPVKATKHSLEDGVENVCRFISSPNRLKTAEILDGSNSGGEQASDKAGNDNLTNAHTESEGVLKKPSWKEKIKLTCSSELSCLGGKTNRRTGLKSTEKSINVNTVGKRKRGRKPKKGGGKNCNDEALSLATDSVVCASVRRAPVVSDKQLDLTSDIFNAMFGMPANELATDTNSVVRPQNDTEFREQEYQHPLYSSSNAQNEVLAHSALNQTQKYKHGVGEINNGGNLELTTQADTSKMQPYVPGSSCRSESSTLKDEIICAFCRTSGDSEAAGQMMHYKNGRAVTEQKEMASTVVHVHRICAEWAPDVYFKDDCVMNLEAEVARGMKIKCTMCGLKGAALGCCFTKCHKSFHVTCALSNPECRWDIDNFVMLCPAHSSRKFPKERKFKSLKSDSGFPTKGTPSRGAQSPSVAWQVLAGSETSQSWTWPSGLSCKWVLCGSALDAAQKEQLNKFASLVGARISKAWSPTVTHVIASTDANGACRRTLKFLMAILEGKWVLKPDWISACIKSGSLVNEEAFEITHDIHDTHDGPKRGRMRFEKQEPKLFEGLSFYLCGEFATSLKGYLQDLVSAAGGVVLHRKPIMDQPDSQSTIVLYNVELSEPSKYSDKDKTVQRRFNEVKSLADALGAKFAAHTWVLESIAACLLQPTCNTNGSS